MKKKDISVKPEIFQAMQNIDIRRLEELPLSDIRPILPCLVRTALCAPVDKSPEWSTARKDVLKILAGIEDVNSIVALLSIDFHALEQDVKKEQHLRWAPFTKFKMTFISILGSNYSSHRITIVVIHV